MPNILEIEAMYSGRRFSGTVKPTIVIAPENNALAPAPATARPTMSITEFLAAAHMIDPASNKHKAKR
jgi:hypothetical protein